MVLLKISLISQWKETPAQVFFCEIGDTFKKKSVKLEKHLQTTAPDRY